MGLVHCESCATGLLMLPTITLLVSDAVILVMATAVIFSFNSLIYQLIHLFYLFVRFRLACRLLMVWRIYTAPGNLQTSRWRGSFGTNIEIRLGMRPPSEWRRYNVTTSLIDWAHTYSMYSRVPKSRTCRNRWTLGKNAQNLIIEYLFHAVSIATNNRTPGIFPTALIVKGVWLLGTPDKTWD